MITDKDRLRICVKAIRRQVEDTPESLLCFGILQKAIMDLAGPSQRQRKSARAYLKEDMIHADLCNLDKGFVREMLHLAGVDLEEEL